jgi:hypothetical protein
MKSFDASIVAQLEGEIARIFLLVELSLGSGTLRYTEADIDLTAGGQRYLSRAFSVGDISQTSNLEVDSLEVTFAAVDQAMVQAVLSQDVRGATAILSMVCLDPNYQVLGVEELFRGAIDDWDLDEQELRLTVLSELFMWSKKTLRKCQASCPWEFAGTECAYAGDETWCDQSYARCVALENTAQFGGFRFMPAIMEADVWWGRVPLVK